MGSGNDGRLAYDGNASGDVQTSVQHVIGRLETLIGARSKHVKAAVADITADGVLDTYHGKEGRWLKNAAQVQILINAVKRTLQNNDATAASALSKARGHVENM